MRPYVIGVPTLMSSPWVIDNIKKTCRTVSAMDWGDRPEAIILVNNNKYNSIEALALECLDEKYKICRIENPTDIGVSASWNQIIEKSCDYQADRIVLLNDDVEVSGDLIFTLAYALEPTFAGGYCAFALDWDDYCFVGEFDENFYPAYYEDADYTYRMKIKGVKVSSFDLLGFGTHQERTSTRDLPREQLAASLARTESNKDYYIRKWGGHPGNEKYTTPFGV